MTSGQHGFIHDKNKHGKSDNSQRESSLEGAKRPTPRTPKPQNSHEDTGNVYGIQERTGDAKPPAPTTPEPKHNREDTKRELEDTHSVPSETDNHKAMAKSTNGEVEEHKTCVAGAGNQPRHKTLKNQNHAADHTVN